MILPLLSIIKKLQEKSFLEQMLILYKVFFVADFNDQSASRNRFFYKKQTDILEIKLNKL